MEEDKDEADSLSLAIHNITYDLFNTCNQSEKKSAV